MIEIIVVSSIVWQVTINLGMYGMHTKLIEDLAINFSLGFQALLTLEIRFSEEFPFI